MKQVSLILSALLFSGVAFGKAKASNTVPAMAETQTAVEAPKSYDLGHGWNLEAFADVEARLTDKDSGDRRGFSVNDTAFMLSKDLGRGFAAMLDFSLNSQGAANGLMPTKDRQEAYMTYQTSNRDWHTKFGEFDAGFGMEANHARDRFFANNGWIKGYVLPAIFTGVREEYSKDNFKIAGILVDPRDTATMTNANPEFGVQARVDGANAYGTAAILINDSKEGTTGGGPDDSKSNNLIDVMGGMKVNNKVRFDAEFDNRNWSSYSKAGTSLGLLGTYAQSDDLSLGLRFEYLSHPVITVPANGNVAAVTVQADTAWQLSVGPTYQVNHDVTLRGDLSYGDVKPDSKAANTDSQHVFAASFSLVANL